MYAINYPYMKHWPEARLDVLRTESCSLAGARRVAAMLDIDPDVLAEGTPLPRGWHFILLGADPRRSALRGDGFPGLGVPMPNLGISRLMLGGRTVEYRDEIPVGATLERSSAVSSITRTATAAGPIAVVSVSHELRIARESAPAVVETQTYLLLEGRSGGSGGEAAGQPITAARTKTIVPDETLLFQYSALGFNSHKIHLDKLYAREVEGFPDLVVNGGLVTLLLTEFLRVDLALIPTRTRVKHVAPLFCGRLMTLGADRDGTKWQLKAFNDKGRIAVEMGVDVQ